MDDGDMAEAPGERRGSNWTGAGAVPDADRWLARRFRCMMLFDKPFCGIEEPHRAMKSQRGGSRAVVRAAR